MWKRGDLELGGIPNKELPSRPYCKSLHLNVCLFCCLCSLSSCRRCLQNYSLSLLLQPFEYFGEKKELIVSRPATEFVKNILIGDYLRLIKGIILEALVQARSDRGGQLCFFGNHGVSEMWGRMSNRVFVQKLYSHFKLSLVA